MRRAAGSKSCTQNLCCIKFFNEFYTRNLTWFYNSPAAVVVVFLARQCLQFLNDFRLRTWHMERKAFAFAFAFEIEPFAALAVVIPCPCPTSLCRCWLSNHRSPGRPYRNVNQTGHSTGSGTVWQGGQGTLPSGFQLDSALFLASQCMLQFVLQTPLVALALPAVSIFLACQ